MEGTAPRYDVSGAALDTERIVFRWAAFLRRLKSGGLLPPFYEECFRAGVGDGLDDGAACTIYNHKRLRGLTVVADRQGLAVGAEGDAVGAIAERDLRPGGSDDPTLGSHGGAIAAWPGYKDGREHHRGAPERDGTHEQCCDQPKA